MLLVILSQRRRLGVKWSSIRGTVDVSGRFATFGFCVAVRFFGSCSRVACYLGEGLEYLVMAPRPAMRMWTLHAAEHCEIFT